ncbi:type II toxin-antitoxin system HicA family toxin [Candidatus Woesearchaeota archaeon]|nr:type II toxin-antitoxin system HicA family toxin [Candidatus Woesearchaeota archaeon]HIH38837.1 type II toxin-antitoxin system HicA family toxin [Candidatus Woesearchaeota archaeon]HIH48906.1 type II toxin-antitoxin system HicA family toxin [Candidatus Woesearchaeota archaeon]HIJ04340.1 type II toxin-antitoxin system HicA family toxin [Candidatus Woesearchaeota archaeon]
MQKLPRLSGKEVITLLKKDGFEQRRQKGSHVILKKSTPEKTFITVVPLHQEIDRGTLLEIIRQAGYTRESFTKLL